MTAPVETNVPPPPEPANVLCERCADFTPDSFLVRVRGLWHCVGCWIKAGRPWGVGDTVSAAELDLIERRNQERMLKQGGTARHLARTGKA